LAETGYCSTQYSSKNEVSYPQAQLFLTKGLGVRRTGNNAALLANLVGFKPAGRYDGGLYFFNPVLIRGHHETYLSTISYPS
jgi:hypothetical protein